MMIDT